MRTRFALLACLVSLLPALAHGQTPAAGAVAVTEYASDTTPYGKNDKVINFAECDGAVPTDTLTLSWTLAASSLPAGSYYRVYAMTGSCPASGKAPDESGSTVHQLTSDFVVANSLSGTLPAMNVHTDFLGGFATPVACTSSVTFNICVLVFNGNDAANSTVQNGLGASGTIAVNVAKPGTATAVSATSGDGALTVRWTAGSPAATRWVVRAAPVVADSTLNCTGNGGEGFAECTGSATTSCRVGGLTNNACYEVTVEGFADNNNASAVSLPSSTVVPRVVDDFWKTYKGAGGVEPGGCSGGPASSLALLVLATAAPRLRRRRP